MWGNLQPARKFTAMCENVSFKLVCFFKAPMNSLFAALKAICAVIMYGDVETLAKTDGVDEAQTYAPRFKGIAFQINHLAINYLAILVLVLVLRL